MELLLTLCIQILLASKMNQIHFVKKKIVIDFHSKNNHPVLLFISLLLETHAERRDASCNENLLPKTWI